MSLIIGVLKEIDSNEKRVAISPDIVKKYVGMGISVLIEKDAGAKASITDKDLTEAGAKIATIANITAKSDMILCIQPPADKTISSMKKGSLLVGGMNAFDNKEKLQDWAKQGIIACAMELMPRITRAQSMDILSSQSNLSGYKSVLDATEHYSKALPMMMTGAGTIAPAKVFVMGAGVAGLQAIATAKRLGAVVSATDVRPASKEQVESLGGSFIAVEDDEFKQAETAGGYAKQMSKEYQAKQAKLVAEHIAKQDIVITTALIPGRDAPILISEDMVKSMKTGSVIVDLAVERGGNCALSKAGEVAEKHGVKIIGHKNFPSRVATDASQLFAKNIFNLLNIIINKETSKIDIDWNDEIIKGIALTNNGSVIHSMFAEEKPKSKAKPKPKAKKVAKKPTKVTVKKTTTSKTTKKKA